jgi:peptidoglycan LD-endopeptidase CwlK
MHSSGASCLHKRNIAAISITLLTLAYTHVVGSFLAIYFLLACLLVWVTMFPEGRAIVVKSLHWLGHRWQRVTLTGSQTVDHLLLNVTLVSKSLGYLIEHSFNWVAKHKWGVSISLLLLTLPPLGIVMFSNGMYLGGFSDDRVQINPQVAALLRGEQLVPPAPLPPEVFLSAEVEQIRPMLVTASRNWQLLDVDFSQRLLLAFKIMREQHGYEMAILEGYRSPDRQDMLSKLGAQVTSATAYQSYHQYGLAADCAFLRDGKLVISERDPWAMKGYALYGEVAETLGLTWGGRWKMMDFGHIEWHKPGFVKKVATS